MKPYKLVEKLKENKEDFEYYPTTKEMIKPIHEFLKNTMHLQMNNILDIGAGTCNFQKYYNSFCTERFKKINILQVIEKSKILIDLLPRDTIVIGTDFDTTTLHDKDLDVIFCNPPYSQFANWMKRILNESTAKYMFMVVPKRWKDDKEILAIIEKKSIDYKILGEFDFLEADRKARAYVDVISFERRYHGTKTAFDEWFDSEFDTSEKILESESEKNIENEIELAENKTDFLVKNYNRELEVLNSHFKAICSLNEEILKTIGVDKNKVREALKMKLKGLKNRYWGYLFNQLDVIRSKLTSKYREELKTKFVKANTVDFTHDNIYSTVLWILKNANLYYETQVTDLYMLFSDYKNVSPYKSNQKFFTQEKTRYQNFHNDNNTHYTLDYRIVCDRLSFGVGEYYCYNKEEKTKNNIDDICVVAENLGFLTSKREYATETGKKHYCYTRDEKVLFEYKIFQNGNTHIKMSLEFSKAFNVESARLLGWIKDRSDIKKEFNHTHLKGCEQYFKSNLQLPLNGQLLLS